MKTMRILFCLCFVGALAFAQEKYALVYAPAQEAKYEGKIATEIQEALLQGQAVGVTGDASASVTFKVVGVDEETKLVTAEVALKNIHANFNGNMSNPEPPAPMKLQINQKGQIRLPEEARNEGALNLIDLGGIPLPLITMLGMMVRMPEQPVACGEEWSTQDIITVPGMGDAAINMRWKLMEVQDNIATIASTAAAIIPDFKVDNPMAPGMQMDIRGARMHVLQMLQKYDMEKSIVLESQATLRLEAQLDMGGGFEMPLQVTLSSQIKPVEEKPAEQQQN